MFLVNKCRGFSAMQKGLEFELILLQRFLPLLGEYGNSKEVIWLVNKKRILKPCVGCLALEGRHSSNGVFALYKICSAYLKSQ